MAENENKNQIVTLDQKLSSATSVKELFEIPDVKAISIRGYEATTGRKDGEARYQQERYAYLEVIHQKPELKQAPNWCHFKVIGKVMRNGWSLRDNRIYLQPVKQGDKIVDIKVDPSPAVRREMLEAMRTDTRNGIRGIKEAPEAQVVVKGDIFIEDKLNHKVIKHEGTEKSVAPDNLDNIVCSYQRIIWEDGKVSDVVVPHYDLVKAKSKSKIKGDGGVWEFVGEACKKTATNRAFRLHHKYAHSLEVVDKEDDDDDTKDTAHVVVDEPQYTRSQDGDTVNTDTGEVMQDQVADQRNQEVEEAKVVTKEKKDKKQYDLLS